MRAVRLAIVISHPIQHFVPLYRSLSARHDLQLRVFYGSRIGLTPYRDPGFDLELSWESGGTPLDQGYDCEFLSSAYSVKRTTFLSLRDPSVCVRLSTFAPDVVIAYGYAQLMQLFVFAWCKAKRVPCLMISDSELLQERGFWRSLIKKLVLPPLLSRYAGFLSVGDKNDEYYRHYGVPDSKLFRSPFPIDEASLERVRVEGNRWRAAFRSAYDIPENAFVFLFVGKLIERKCPGDALALLEITGRCPVYLVYAGDGPLRRELEHKAGSPKFRENRAVFTGFLNLDTLPHAYVASDALIHPASHDPHPLVTSEAAFFGLPLLLSDKVGSIGPTDIARPGENCLVFPLGHRKTMQIHGTEMLRDPNLYGALAAASKRISRETSLSVATESLANTILKFSKHRDLA